MAKHLRKCGEPHVIFDNLSTGHRIAVGGSDLVVGDLLNPQEIAAALDRYRPDVVLHFAAKSLVGESLTKPHAYWENNIVGGWNLLEAMRSRGIGRIVFSSTAAIYGNPDRVPIAESAPKRPVSPYGETKLAFEQMLGAYGRAYGLKSVSLRYFNAAGADPGGEIGEDHRPETHLIPAAILAATRGEILKVYGDDYATADGTCVRDYVHVTDLCDAHGLAIRHLRTGGASVAYNLGSGGGFSVLDVVQAVGASTGRVLKTEVAPRREGDPATLIASSAAIRQDWGWVPQYVDLGVIVEHAANWRAGHPEGYTDERGPGKPPI